MPGRGLTRQAAVSAFRYRENRLANREIIGLARYVKSDAFENADRSGSMYCLRRKIIPKTIVNIRINGVVTIA